MSHTFGKEMKKALPGALRLIALIVLFLGALLLGSIPFLVSFICGLALRIPWIAFALGLAATIAITLYSSAFPETLRSADSVPEIHDRNVIPGTTSLVVSLGWNLFFAHVGVSTGLALRQGFQKKNAEQGAGADAEPAA